MERTEDGLYCLDRRAEAISHINIQRNVCIQIWTMGAAWKGAQWRRNSSINSFAVASPPLFIQLNHMKSPTAVQKGQFHLVQSNKYLCSLSLKHAIECEVPMSHERFIMPSMQQKLQKEKNNVKMEFFQIHHSYLL